MLIIIADLEVFYRVGVSDTERARPQRLLLTVELEPGENRSTMTDDLSDTVDYYEVSRDLLQFGEHRSWRLLEKLASDLADELLARYRLKAVTVEVKKFVLPEARHVAVRLCRTAA
ncbi:MAG: dihydroneopterin aldolase [Verrucomicrobiota bacterium]|nr:dihydroneopterin aldolase [Limisphaera sp.]MDW8381005.1 dihydroneopterin aldolase [Verrucomicrobiota bacterium]